MNSVLGDAIQIISAITGFSAVCTIIIKPLREFVFGVKDITEGQKCMLRSDMTAIYYANKDNKQLHQYEYENFMYLYEAYVRLKGNSFIDKIKKEIEEDWTVIQ